MDLDLRLLYDRLKKAGFDVRGYSGSAFADYNRGGSKEAITFHIGAANEEDFRPSIILHFYDDGTRNFRIEGNFIEEIREILHSDFDNSED